MWSAGSFEDVALFVWEGEVVCGAQRVLGELTINKWCQTPFEEKVWLVRAVVALSMN